MSVARGATRRYSFQTHGQSDRGNLIGNYLLRPGAARVWRPAYNGGPTTMRIFPARCPTDPSIWDPYRLSAEKDAFGDWIRRYPAVRSMGDPGVTFITHDPSDPSVDPQTTPGYLVWRAVDKAVAAMQDPGGWAGLLRGGQNRGAQLPRPSEVYLVQCAIMQHKGKVCEPPKGGAADDDLHVMELGPSAGRAMLDLFNEINPDFNGMDNDFVHKMKYGDPVSLQHGQYVTFYNLKEGDPRARQAYNSQQRQASDAFGQRGGGSGREKEEIGFGCYVEPTFNGFPADLSSVEPLIASRVRPWDEILNFPTLEEQAALLADKLPPDVLMYAWRDFPEWIPEHVRRNAANARSVGVGAAGGMSYGPQAPPQPQGFGAPASGQTATWHGPTTPPQGFGAPAAAPPVAGPQPPVQDDAVPFETMPAQPVQAAPVTPVSAFGAPAQRRETAPAQVATPPAAAPAPGGFGAPAQPIAPTASDARGALERARAAAGRRP